MAEPKKILIVVLDGMGDRACRALRGLTPLQNVRTQNLDWFVEHGISGLCDPVAPGVRAGSDVAHLSILGYDPYEVYTGRGPLEAFGSGMDMQPGDIAFRCNFATVNSEFDILDRRAGRIREPETLQLLESLDGIEIDGVECIVGGGTEHRAVLLLRGDGLSPDVTDCDPGGSADRLLPCIAKTPEAELTADVINGFIEECYERLRTDVVNRKRMAAGLPPANMLIPRGPGGYPSIEPFSEKYDMRGACVAGVGLVKGICKACGLDVYLLPDACNGGMDSDLMLKMRGALEALEEYDFVLMNIKAPDVAGHDGDAKAKSEVVKRIDRAVGMLKERKPDDLVAVFTCDHCTPCSLQDHSGDPVPICFYTDGMVWDDATEFSETGCARGSVGRIRARDIMPMCLDLANRSTKFGS